ncbi:hypothetical protein MATL_G00029840 [Megalops atlanticus]|uniref:Pseudopodium-enriched atypical kinase 1 n=1 Tax=Megalops atlanticus TaxID=7932 RepID=A0A9D3QI78_MEGAT|nr:hypothetical protein MATL_G00029840 [Megalops atlanticus]
MDRPAAKMDHVCIRAGRQGHPPPLPAKQRRSLYSQGSSTSLSMDLEPEGDSCSPRGPQNQVPAFSEVFSAPTDCQAPQCPIHHGAGSSHRHQERFFSDNTPPPVPKKLTRALSLPGGCLYPHCSLPSCHQNYGNPLYMLAPIKDPQLSTEKEEEKAVIESTFPSKPLTLLRFDTPDFQLPCFFKNLQDQDQVCLDIQQCHLLFLKRIARQMETTFLCGTETTKEVESIQPQDFKLCEGYQSKQIGDVVFYTVSCPKLPGGIFSAKVYKPNNVSTTLALTKSLPPHTNIQQVLVHFPRSAVADGDAISSPASPGPDETSPQSPCDGSADPDRPQEESRTCKGSTVLSLLSGDCEVDVERDLPWGTLEDFVQDGISLHCSQPQLYERRLSLLLLQLAQGLQHLRRHAATYTELQPQTVALVWSEDTGGRREEAGGTGTSDRAEREQAEKGVGARIEEEHGEGESGWVQKTWKKLGTPRVVITTFQPLSAQGQNAPSEQLQLGSLIQRCLHLPENLTPKDGTASPETPQGSPYSHGLLQLASLLLDKDSRLQMGDAVGILQALLWGPRAELFQQNQPGPFVLHNWLSVKRSLLVLKLAERGLSDDRCSLDWEDCLCLQYLSSTDPDAVLKIATLLSLPGSHNYMSTAVKN